MTVTVRPITPADILDFMAMLHELASYEQAPSDALCCSEADFLRDGFGPDRAFECLFVEVGNVTIGFATLFPTYSSWQGKRGLMIHDLFVRESARGKGAATALVQTIQGLAAKRGCSRVDVNVLTWNSARQFYEKLGFLPQPDWVLHRFAVPDSCKEICQ